jgi:hypothetical protein
MTNALIAMLIGFAVLGATIAIVFCGATYVANKIDAEDEALSQSRRQKLKDDFPHIFGSTPDR